VLLGNRGERIARVVFARNEKAGDIDLGSLFTQVVGPDGRGGGKPHFVTGVVQNEALDRVMEQIPDEVAKVS
jgi:hypothetical protein